MAIPPGRGVLPYMGYLRRIEWSLRAFASVFASICEHASSAFIFASTSSDRFSHASSEHLEKSLSCYCFTLFFFRKVNKHT